MPKLNYESEKHKFVDSTNRKLTTSLFKELKRPDVSVEPPFSLADWKTVYLSHNDPTEYEQAMELVGDWEHWCFIRNHKTLKPYFDAWAEELEVKMRSQAVRAMIKHSESQAGTAAAKWIAEGGVAGRDKRTKPAKEKENRILSRIQQELEDDYRRIGEM